jgi:ubiquinone/menaquinone biosynthesis C-methylase UbiE
MHYWKKTALWLGCAAVVIAVLMLVSRDGETEIERLADLLEIRPGDTAADVGAGDGWLSLEVATMVGETGNVFAAELSARRRDDIRESVAVAGLDNVTVVEAREHETNLAPGCCDAIFLRRVYHHLTDPAAYSASLYDSLKPGGRLAIVELEFNGILRPLRPWPHWADDEQVVAEVTAAGLTHLTTADWPIAAHYAAVFRKER